MTEKSLLDDLHLAVTLELLERVKSGQATASELTAAINFLKANNANLDIITAESPMGNLLESLPFDISERLQ